MPLNVNLKNGRFVVIESTDGDKIIIGLNPNQNKGVLIDAPENYKITWSSGDLFGFRNNVEEPEHNGNTNCIPENKESL